VNARNAIDRKIRRMIASAVRSDTGTENVQQLKTALAHYTALATLRDEFFHLPIPEEYRTLRQCDFTESKYNDFRRQVLEIYDLYPNLRDAICHCFGKRSDAERDFLRQNIAIIIALLAFLTSLAAVFMNRQ